RVSFLFHVQLTSPTSTLSLHDALPILGHLDRAPGELEHTFAERLQVRIVGGARNRALVVALHEHHGLPQGERHVPVERLHRASRDRKSTRLNSSHSQISYAVFCLKKKK